MPRVATPEPWSFVLRDDRAALVEAAVDELAVAAAVVSGTPPVLRLDRLWVRDDLRRQGLGRLLLGLLRTWAVDHGATVLSVEVPQSEPALVALGAGTRVLGEHLEKPVGPAVAVPTIGYRPMTPVELGPWTDVQVQAYAQDNLARSGGDLELATRRSRTDFARLLPDGLETPNTSLVVLTSGEERVGHLWLAHHHREPDLSFVFDVEVSEPFHGRGFGRAAMVAADALARDAGDTRIGLHVFAGNGTARRLYRTHGYTVRSTSHDLLAPATP